MFESDKGGTCCDGSTYARKACVFGSMALILLAIWQWHKNKSYNNIQRRRQNKEDYIPKEYNDDDYYSPA